MVKMNATVYWLNLAFLSTVLFLLRPSLSKFDENYLRTLPCNIEQNYTEGTVAFYCQGRGLREVPHILENVTILNLSENRIRNLTAEKVGKLRNLTALNLNWLNKDHMVNVTPGVFVNLSSLRYLNLNGAGLPHVPRHLPKTLLKLTLIENKINSLTCSSFPPLPELTHLYLSKNCYYWNPCNKVFEIEKGSFANLRSLRHLTLSYNNLTRVPQGLPASLNTLELASNSIAYIGEDDFNYLPNLAVLKIQGNCPRCQNAPFPCVPCNNQSIQIHEQAFKNLRRLTLLHLAGNSLSDLKKSWFENMPDLKELYLSFNFLMTAIEHGEFLNSLPLLKKLDLSFNYNLKTYPYTITLAPTFANLSSLRILHMQALVFKKIDNNTLSPLYGLQNLTVLDIATNFIVNAESNLFSKFPNLKLLYLSENRLYPVSNSGNERQLGSKAHPPISLPPLLKSGSRKEHSFQAPSRLVKPECLRAGQVLDLSKNNIFFISPEQFEGYSNISCLNLSRNGFAAAPNGTELASLPHLKYLDLSYNKIDLAYDYAFSELKSLEVLDLSFNPHYFTVSGVTHNLNFMRNLPKLRVLNMSSNSIFTLTTKRMYSSSLNELQFQDNHLGQMWKVNDWMYDNLFQNLTNLTYLDISRNLITKIPKRVYRCMPKTLRKFRLAHNGLNDLEWDEMKRFTHLEELILSFNHLVNISENISVSIPNLRYLDLRYNWISQLKDDFLIGAINLQRLDLSHNRMTVINASTFPNNSYKLWLHGNPFHCTCEIMEFVHWINNSEVKVQRLATSVTCRMPRSVKGRLVVLFDIQECVNPEIALTIYFLTTFFIICVTFISTVMHLFYWDVSYVFYYVKARLKGFKYLSSEDSIYDAFVTYDTKDPQVSNWVFNNLRVQLEEQGERHLPICLEERDWVPGCPLLDSMMQSIQQSRKTVFILTRNYINSGSFKMAVYLAHQRLLEENKDVIVLLLLEPVLQSSHFLRLRRRLCGCSVLEWPKSPDAEPWFWQCLRNAICVENSAVYSKTFSRYFTIRGRSEKE
ncbi:toll-like receptor 7 [Hoplias malabaricus]|uniref:toll-like receptor 7 n=1 Tax=Hoplias malabaricus TaxID=27720 RepID=UPI0034623635